MSIFTDPLILAGALIIAGAVVYAWWYEHRHPRDVEQDAVEHRGVGDDERTGEWLSVMHEEPLLCDQPCLPPAGSDCWWSIRFARGRELDRRRLKRVGATLPADWADVVAEADVEIAADTDEFRRLVESVFVPTAEHRLVSV